MTNFGAQRCLYIVSAIIYVKVKGRNGGRQEKGEECRVWDVDFQPDPLPLVI
jgi:hypothetical protein